MKIAALLGSLAQFLICSQSYGSTDRFETLAYGFVAVREGLDAEYSVFSSYAKEHQILHPEYLKDYNCVGSYDGGKHYKFVCLLETTQDQMDQAVEFAKRMNVPVQIERVMNFRVQISHQVFDLVGLKKSDRFDPYFYFDDYRSALGLQNGLFSKLPDEQTKFSPEQVRGFYDFLLQQFPKFFRASYRAELWQTAKSLSACAVRVDTSFSALTSGGWKDLPLRHRGSIPYWHPLSAPTWSCWGHIAAAIGTNHK